eukprot:SAG11_NODE_9417_length_913_cov_5.914005_2_plen_104_part_00
MSESEFLGAARPEELDTIRSKIAKDATLREALIQASAAYNRRKLRERNNRETAAPAQQATEDVLDLILTIRQRERTARWHRMRQATAALHTLVGCHTLTVFFA